MIPVNELITKVKTSNVKSILSNVFLTQSGGGGSINSVSGTANQINSNTNSGAVTLSLPSNVIFPGTWQIGSLNYSDTGILWSAQSSINSYNQVIVQNTNNGSSASTNFLVSNDLGTATTHFLEIGKNSSGFIGSGSFNLANASYLDDASDDLVIGTLSNKTLHFVTNNSMTDNLSITGAGVFTFTVPINGSNFNSSWTATANNQNAFLFNGTITSENVASDNFNYLVISPTMVRNAGNPASQVANAVLINATFSNNPTTQNFLKMQNNGIDMYRFGNDLVSFIASTNANFRLTITNQTSGTAAQASLSLTSSSALSLTCFSASTTTSGMNVQNTAMLNVSAGAGLNIGTSNSAQCSIWTNNIQRMLVSSTGNISPTAGTTGMTDGFFYIPAAAGAPSGTPTSVSGCTPMYYDTTNNQFYIYNSVWKKVTLA